MGTERPIGRDAAEFLGQLGHDLAPQVGVDEDAMHKHDRLTGAALSIANRALREPNLLELAELLGI